MNLDRVGGVKPGTVFGLTVAIGALLFLTLLPGTMAAQPPARASPTSCTVGKGPEFPGYDPVSHRIYVPDGLNGTITVLKNTCTTVATINLPGGAYPVMAAFD